VYLTQQTEKNTTACMHNEVNKTILQYVGVIKWGYLWDMLNHTAWFVPSFMMITSGIEAILIKVIYLNNFRGCGVGITDGRDL
jgi:hypothetical protein